MKKINETLGELLVGILCSGIVIWIAALAIAGWDAGFAIGFWIGVVLAAGLAVHIYRSIDRALDMYPKDAEKYMRKAYTIRAALILIVAGVVAWLKIGYVMALFVGVLCLKFGAFLQPLIHRLSEKFFHKS